MIAGERTKLQVAHFKLSHSRAFMVRAYPLQTHEMPSTLTTGRSPCSAVYRGAASTTFGEPIARENARWGAVIQKNNIKPD